MKGASKSQEKHITMSIVWIFIWTLAMVGAVVYAQYRIPSHSTSTTQSWIVRLMLVVIGVGVGFVSVSRYQGSANIPPVLAFLNGFGAAHVPAAFILWLKGRGNVP
ncbi:hypothetical protein Noc_2888 [Nitrosococcus oceani ATCC 19707]|uniref:Transmembrane protein n=3 Tax=Nitrosococcus oceani TaxID=1229 RepID=Q3J762_NITOC|nr:hypothetical protein Noc_2888 [Nitrosococcus oceani ATCC 19707]KFI18220.1 hypothetical protein IB75_15315 [Nitrosococcus oceani C-27]KFI21537.1 hypothetical protein HW44_14950 [Nitrosococcus oceani]